MITLKSLILCLIPLAVAVNAIGVLPMYLGMTEGLARPVLNRIIWQSILTASIVALTFLYRRSPLRNSGIRNMTPPVVSECRMNVLG